MYWLNFLKIWWFLLHNKKIILERKSNWIQHSDIYNIHVKKKVKSKYEIYEKKTNQ